MSKELIERLLDNRVTGFNLTVAAVEAADALEAQQKRIEELEQLNKESCDVFTLAIDGWKTKLAAAQAQLKVLREALYDQLNDCINFNGGNLTICIMEQSTKVLEQPTDDSALREMLKAERERCAKLADAQPVANSIAAKIREMEDEV